MLKGKVTLYAVIALMIFSVGQFFIYKNSMSSLKDENADLKEGKKVELKKVRDSAFVKIETLTKKSNKRFDSIINIPPTIKWKVYEKPIYANRSIDDALDVISKYKYDKGTKRKGI